MAVYFTPAGKPHCSRCFLSLSGRESSDHCPSCGTWYAIDRARLIPCRQRLLALNILDRTTRRNAMALFPILIASPGLRLTSVLLLVLGNAALVGGIGYLAIHSFFKLCGF
jgi:hypothetical protein